MNYYLTTPIYYVNAAPHIGHTYTTLAADTIRRFKRMRGYDVVLTTGTDEHGLKIERAAKKTGKTPQEFTTIISNEFRRQWKMLGLVDPEANPGDRFIRTTDPRHVETVQELFRRCQANGFIYKERYTGMYDVGEETFVQGAKPGDVSPVNGQPLEEVTEENYFFRLSAFQDRLLELYETQPGFVRPDFRRNEVLSFVRGGLEDLSISRGSISWGIPLPTGDGQVFYVWFDALSSYYTAVAGEDRWPADLHLIGKEILRFHAVYWPAFLMAAGWPLPKQIFAHGWLLFENDKMSKSRGNIVRAEPIHRVMGIEGLRYFLLREIPFGHDGGFSYDALVQRFNADLANGLGNLASRTVAMLHQYFGGRIPSPEGNGDATVAVAAAEAIGASRNHYENFEFSKALEAIWGLISKVDKFIVEKKPWTLAKSTAPEDRAALDDALFTAAEALRVVTVLVAPVLPASAQALWEILGGEGKVEAFQWETLAWGQLPKGGKVEALPEAPLFPRLKAEEVIPRMRDLEQQISVEQARMVGKDVEPAPAGNVAPLEAQITIDDFAKVDMRVGRILQAEPVPKADKLLHLTVDLGEAQPRTILAGVALYYKPEALVGRKVLVAANLAPRKLRGIESNGMILAASLEGGSPVLAGFLEDVPVGARLK
ncbi:MAG: methionine--tRNA ligase [Bryobacterales bacterium]|nr:methionine--tRNA ligase [Bryobacterales bacterium]